MNKKFSIITFKDKNGSSVTAKQFFNNIDGRELETVQAENGQIWVSIKGFCEGLGMPEAYDIMHGFIEPGQLLALPSLSDPEKIECFMSMEEARSLLAAGSGTLPGEKDKKLKWSFFKNS